MNDTQTAVAGVDIVNNDTKGEDIHDVGKGFSLFSHFRINAIEVFLASNDLPFNMVACERLLELLRNVLNELLTTTARGFARSFDPLGSHRIQRPQAKILKLHTHFVHTQSGCYRCINIECFVGNAFFGLGFECS